MLRRGAGRDGHATALMLFRRGWPSKTFMAAEPALDDPEPTSTPCLGCGALVFHPGWWCTGCRRVVFPELIGGRTMSSTMPPDSEFG